MQSKNQCSINEKVEMRTAFVNKRNAMLKSDVDYNSNIIANNILNMELIRTAKSIMSYLSFGNEVNTFGIIKQLFLHEKIVCVPVCAGKRLFISEISSFDDLVKSKFGVPEPKNIVMPHILPQVCITPGTVFDVNCNRMGFGMGFYDRFFAKNPIIKVGICHDFQIAAKIPTEKTDIKMDYVISEKRQYINET